MVFSSLMFIFRFMPLALATYFITPNRYKNHLLILLSLIFYAWGEPKYVLLMGASIVVDFFLSQIIGKNRENKSISVTCLILSIIFNLGMLGIFKYANFIIDNINMVFGTSLNDVKLTLPLGISFYTFQTLSYTIDVYLDNVKAEKNIVNFAAFVTLFPQLIAGPIVKYSDIHKEINQREINLAKIQEGVELFIIGLAKKVLIANNIGLLWTQIEAAGFSKLTMITAWLGLIAFALQIYFDFSGYSTMAIGLGKMLGFTFPENFNFPYISRSISEFWNRWHMTLGSWFKEYVYIPLGGNRKGIKRQILNLLIVWFLTGLWHGAEYNFILWGLFFFVFISLEKLFLQNLLKKHRIFSHLYTIILLLLGWMIFAITDLQQIRLYLCKLFIPSYNLEWIYYLRNYIVVLIIAMVCSTPLIENSWKKIQKINILKTLVLMALFIISVAYLVDTTYNPFLYFRF